MIEVKKYLPKEVVPQDELKAWRDSVRKSTTNCPDQVERFIAAVAEQLPAFGRIKNFTTKITGYELKLAGMKEFNGETIYDAFLYDLPVPHMVAVDHYSSMNRAYNRRGRQGIVAYIRSHADPDAVDKLLYILDSVVLGNESEAFRKEMKAIKKAA